VQVPNFIWVDGWLIEDRLAEFADVFEVDLGDSSPEIVEQMSERRRFTYRVKGTIPVGNHQDQAAASTKHAFELTQCSDGVGQVLDHVTRDNGVEGFIGDGTKAIDIQVDVKFRVWPSRLACQFRPCRIPSALDRTVGIEDTCGGRGWERCMAGSDFEDIANQCSTDVRPWMLSDNGRHMGDVHRQMLLR